MTRLLLILCFLFFALPHGHAETEMRPHKLIEVESDIPTEKWFYTDVIRKAQNGSPTSMYTLAIMYYEGKGVPESLTDSVGWLEKAANVGYAPAMTALGNLYRWDDRMQNMERALDWFLKGADKGEFAAMRGAGDIFSAGIEDVLPPNPEAAMQWYNNAERAKARAVKRALRQQTGER